MIVSTMSSLDIYNALQNDSQKLHIRAERLRPQMIKRFKKMRKFPAWLWDEYTHQESHNKFLISFCVPSKECCDYPIIDRIAIMPDGNRQVIVQWGCWPYRPHGSTKVIPTKHISYYFGHFFSRYRERVHNGSNMCFNDLLCRYFSRNGKVNIPIELNEEIQRNYKGYGEFATVAFEQKEGFCFIRNWCEGDPLTIGESNSDFISVVLYTTIVTHKMMTEIQGNAIRKENQNYLRNFYKNLYEDLMKDKQLKRFIALESIKRNTNKK